jgi:hypothetical protein
MGVSRGRRDGSIRLYSRFSRPKPLIFLPSSSSIEITRLSGSCSKPAAFQKIWYRRKSNPDLCICRQELSTLDHRGDPQVSTKKFKILNSVSVSKLGSKAALLSITQRSHSGCGWEPRWKMGRQTKRSDWDCLILAGWCVLFLKGNTIDGELKNKFMRALSTILHLSSI